MWSGRGKNANERMDSESMMKADFLFSNCVLVNSQLFFVDTQSGLPAIMNSQNGKAAYCEVFRDYILRAGDSIDFMEEFGGNVYALETAGDYLVIFEWDERQCSYIPLNCNNHKWGNFVAFERYDSVFYIFPKYENKIIVFHTEEGEIEEVADRFDETGEMQCACRDGNNVWLLTKEGDILYSFNLEERRQTRYILRTRIEDCADCIVVGGSVYLLNNFGILYQWNIGSEEIQVINTFGKKHLKEKEVCRIINAGNRLFVLPSFGKDIKILDLRTSEMEICHKYPSDFSYCDIGWSKYYGHCEDESFYYFAMRRANYFLKIRKTDGEFTWIKPKILNGECRGKLLGAFAVKQYLEEGEGLFCERQGYLEGMLKHMPNRSEHNREKTDIGRRIYNEGKKVK